MRPAELQAVVRSTVVSKVVHLSNGCTSTESANDKGDDPDGGMLASPVEAVGNHKSQKDDHYWDNCGDRSEGGTVVELNLVLAIA